MAQNMQKCDVKKSFFEQWILSFQHAAETKIAVAETDFINCLRQLFGFEKASRLRRDLFQNTTTER